jgi:hypothetical protein
MDTVNKSHVVWLVGVVDKPLVPSAHSCCLEVPLDQRGLRGSLFVRVLTIFVASRTVS